MKTKSHQTQQIDLFSQFNESRLNYEEMVTVRGGDKQDEGNVADQQEDGFN